MKRDDFKGCRNMLENKTGKERKEGNIKDTQIKYTICLSKVMKVCYYYGKDTHYIPVCK